jgi:hypothetical protein
MWVSKGGAVMQYGDKKWLRAAELHGGSSVFFVERVRSIRNGL